MSDMSIDIGVSISDIDSIIKQLTDLNSKFTNLSKTTKTTEKDIKKLEPAAKEAAKGFSGAFKSIENSIKNLDKAIKGLPLVGMITAIGGVATAFSGLKAGADNASKALDVQNSAIQNMSMSISRNTKLNQSHNKSLMNFAGELQKTTAYGDEFTMSLIGIGAQANLNEEEIKKLTQMSLDLATATGMDAAAAMRQLSVGMSDSGKAIAVAEQAAVGFTKSEKAMIAELESAGKQAEATAIIMGKLEVAVGGKAQKEIETYAGKQKQLANIMGDVDEEHGRMVQAFATPFLEGQTKAFEGFYNILKDPTVQDAIQKTIAGFQILGNALIWVIDKAFTPTKAFFNYLLSAAQGVVTHISNLAEAIFNFGKGSADSLDQAKTAMMDVLGFFTNAIEQITGGIINLAGAWGSFVSLDFNSANEKIQDVGDSFKKIIDYDTFSARGKEVVQSAVDTYDNVKKHWEDPIESPVKGLSPSEEKEITKSFTNPYRAALDLSNKTIPQLKSMQSKYASDIKNIEDQMLKAKSESELKALENSKKYLDSDLKQIESHLKAISDKTKKAMSDTNQIANAVMGGITSVMDSINAGFTEKTINLDVYDQKLLEINERIKAQEEERANKAVEEDNISQKQLDWLEKQSETQDHVGKRAIAIKQEEIKKAMEADKKEQEEKKRLSNEQKELEKKNAFDIAMAQYAKDVAVHNNAVANAETKGKMDKAQAISDGVMGVAKGALGVATSFAQNGPIGAIMGLAMLPGVIAPIFAATAQAQASAASLESLKGQAPKPPAFQYGTSGYSLEQGESAIVGEAGAEVVKNRGGMLEVQSAYQTAQKDESSEGMTVIYNIYASQFSQSEIKTMMEEFMQSFKTRGVSYAQ